MREQTEGTDLIGMAQNGDVKAFSVLYADIYKDLYRFALCMTRHPQDAEDAVSDAVVTAYEKIGQLKSADAFRSWMFTILYNKCVKTLKKRKKDSDMETAVVKNREEVHETDHARCVDVRKAFETLDEEERMIVAFSVFGGYRSDEIAAKMKKNAATVRSRKSRAMEKLRKMLV